MRKVFLVVVTASLILSCNGRDTTETAKKGTSATAEEQTAETQKIFTEGKIDVQVYFPGNRFGEIQNKLLGKRFLGT